MNFKSLGFALTLTAALSGGAVLAQDAPAPVKEEKKEGKAGSFSGVGFFEYSQELDDNDGDDKKPGTFKLNRAYLTYSNNIGDKLSAKVTIDATDWDASVEEDSPGEWEGKNKVGVFLKNAYFQYKDELGGVGVTTQVGVIGTPLIGLTDKLGGMRWITQNQMDLKKMDNSADIGVSLELDLMGFATLTGALLNGEGYKYIQSENYSGKAFDVVLSATPIKGLYINGYFNNEYEEEDDKQTSFGAGLAWSDKMYKVGLNYMYVTEPNSGNKEGSYIDGWVNVNMNDAIGMPVLAIGRVMYEMPKESTEDKNLAFLIGPGYQFNGNLQTAAMFGYSKAESADDAELSLAVKFEFKY